MAEVTTVRDQLASVIRTAVPIGVGFLLSLLARKWGIVLDDTSSQALASGVTAVLAAVYYVVVRFLEGRWAWVGWLLGLALPPSYSQPVDSPENKTFGRPIQ